jgi:hypothetical protein
VYPEIDRCTERHEQTCTDAKGTSARSHRSHDSHTRGSPRGVNPRVGVEGVVSVDQSQPLRFVNAPYRN